MTMALDPARNCKKESRKSLSDEIDRFDKMIDGLAEAIPATIADAVKESVAAAVAETFRATITEIMANPDIIALLRGARCNFSISLGWSTAFRRF